MREGIVGLILNILIFITLSSIFINESKNLYYLPILFFILVLITLSISETIEYLNRKYFQSIAFLILILMWITVFTKPISQIPNLIIYTIESILVTLITLFIIIYYPRVWDNRIKALKPYEKALILNPNDTIALNNKGVELTNQKRYNQAMNCFHRVLEIEPEDPAALYNKSILYAKKGNTNKMKYLKKALELDPKLENAEKSGKLLLEDYRDEFIEK